MRIKVALLIPAVIVAGLIHDVKSQTVENSTVKFAPGITLGYNRGFGMGADFTLYDFISDFPFELRLGVGYSFINPGSASEARRIFINNATNGVPEKRGTSFDARFDFLLHQSLLNLKTTYLVFGPRFSTYKGHFEFIGGNEVFDIKSKQWGLGLGAETHFQMAQRMKMIISLGVDYYFPSTIKGHDTSYSPDDDNVNPRDDNQNGDVPFTYKDADKAIKQPRFMPRAMLGLNYSF